MFKRSDVWHCAWCSARHVQTVWRVALCVMFRMSCSNSLTCGTVRYVPQVAPCCWQTGYRSCRWRRKTCGSRTNCWNFESWSWKNVTIMWAIQQLLHFWTLVTRLLASAAPPTANTHWQHSQCFLNRYNRWLAVPRGASQRPRRADCRHVQCYGVQLASYLVAAVTVCFCNIK